MTFEDFKKDCLNNICNRHTFKNEQCFKNSKIEKCYYKYCKQLQKEQEKKEKQILELYEKQQKELEKQNKEFKDKKEKYLRGEIEDLYGYQDKIDLKWIELKNKIIKRDKNCIIWNYLLTPKQKIYILENFWHEYKRDSKILDMAHLESIARRPELKYNEDNVVLICRFFHRRFDSFFDIVTGEKISNEEREFYIKLFKDYIKYIKEKE